MTPVIRAIEAIISLVPIVKIITQQEIIISRLVPPMTFLFCNSPGPLKIHIGNINRDNALGNIKITANPIRLTLIIADYHVNT